MQEINESVNLLTVAVIYSATITTLLAVVFIISVWKAKGDK